MRRDVKPNCTLVSIVSADEQDAQYCVDNAERRFFSFCTLQCVCNSNCGSDGATFSIEAAPAASAETLTLPQLRPNGLFCALSRADVARAGCQSFVHRYVRNISAGVVHRICAFR